MRRAILFIALIVGCLAQAKAESPAKLELKAGDHVALVGNTFADRLQFSGYFETLIVAKYPNHNLVFRNLAAAGDEVVIRHRSENFGSPDDWLKRVQADVIFGFFGFNESFKGPDGLPKFKTDLDTYLKHLAEGNYSGKGAPRVVLFSPIANERHRDPNFPDPTANNVNIELYAKAMGEVAAANHVQFVELFSVSKQLFAAMGQRNESLTINGVHLSEYGDQMFAAPMFQGVFGEAPPTGNTETLRLAINDKNWEWHSRYRTVDGYNVYGGRSQMVYNGISNYKVMQEEMAVRDAMTANRDKRIWAIAKGGDAKVDDSELPAVTSVPTNKRGQNPDGTFQFLGGEEAIAKMKIHSNTKIQLFASEEKFPELAKPLQMAWDTKGRLWVSVWPNYPERTPESKVGDSLLIFEDTDGDGKADKVTHFLDDLNCPTGFQFYKDGVLVMQAPDLWFVRDTDGDGKADWKQRVLMGMDSADSHHTANAICLDPGGSIYLSDGVFHRTQVETAHGPVRNEDAAIYRFEPRTGEFDRYIAYGFANPHGRVFDYWGNDIVTDATGNESFFGPAFSGYIDYPAKHPGMRQFWERPSRPCPGTTIVTSRHFPDDWQGNFLNINVIGFQGISRVKVTEEGSGLKGTSLENLVESSDPNFRPIAVDVGPDGAIYFLDWHNPIIGHLQHHLRDPNRDKIHGRIYKMTYEGRPLMKPAKIEGQPVAALLNLLKEPENQTRELAKVELGKHETSEVIPAVKAWIATLDPKDPAYQHHLAEALWVHQWHNVVNVDLLKQMLRSPEPRARAAATRVLGYWRDRVPDALALLKPQADDENPRVRLEGVRVASFFRDAQAAETALLSLKHPTDYYLDYTLKETLRQLEPLWRKAIAAGKPFAADNPVGLSRLIDSVSTAELLNMPKTIDVLEAILKRADAADADRAIALNQLAKKRKTDKMTELLGLLDSDAAKNPAIAGRLGRLLPIQSAADLKAARSRIDLLTKSQSSDVRQSAWAALALADNSFDTIWATASKSTYGLLDILGGIPLLPDADFRAKAYAKVLPLLSGLPPELAASAKGKGGGLGRVVRVELPRKGTLTLAEVEVFSDGKNIARIGKAKQSSTSNGGTASHAIDGRTDGSFNSGTQTHSVENENNPWWEVDLGGDFPVEAVTVWNRRDDGLGKRLDGFTLSVIDSTGNVVFKKTDIPAPDASVQISLDADPAGQIRRAAIQAIVGMNQSQDVVFTALGGLIAKNLDVTTAARGIRTLPRASWPKTEVAPVAQALVAWAKSVPVEGRTSQTYVETVQFAGDLAGTLPSEQATALRKELREFRVPMFVIRTVREQMRYDTTRLVVEPGKAVQVIVENGDFMPHNLVVVYPGAREEIGTITAAMKPDELDSRGRAFVPRNTKIVTATKLIEPGMKETLQFTVPEAEGTYEYVCTYPGHWMLMWGTLIVTKDVDGYLAAHPDAPEAGAAAGGEHEHHEHK
ncbi:MAG TPA: PVC-type heme-binding CxxCH protein [Candidatus Limnocylindria bacterium]|jgi:glucose/arabinose dehydrogenase/azurin|nr:PVC-type heme-binding CxxCH protein [Candidatus Limnocylindria bacterium]